MKFIRVGKASLITVLLALLLIACSQATPEPATFRIEMTEYAFEPSEIQVQVGQEVTLELVNLGELGHELMIGREVAMMEGKPAGYEVDMFETAGVEPEVSGDIGHEHQEEEEMHMGTMFVVEEKGHEATVKFTVTKDMEGDWEMGCFEQEGVHYTAGMVGNFIVNP
jgi:uncharacterized cupredoxin-like copper-binding protein